MITQNTQTEGQVILNGEQGDLTNLLEKVKTNPKLALNAVNNMKIKIETEKTAIETSAKELEGELDKITNPTIHKIYKLIMGADSKEQLMDAEKQLDEMQNVILKEMENLLKSDGELVTTLQRQLGL